MCCSIYQCNRELGLLLHLFQKPGICWYHLEFLDNAVTFSSLSGALLAGHAYVTQTVIGTFPTQLQDTICIRLSGIIGNLTCIDFGLHFTVVFCSTLGSEVSIYPLAGFFVTNIHTAAHCAAQFRLPLGEIIVAPLTSCFWLKYLSFELFLCMWTEALGDPLKYLITLQIS